MRSAVIVALVALSLAPAATLAQTAPQIAAAESTAAAPPAPTGGGITRDQFIERAKTSTGLRVTVSILNKVYETGRKYAEGFKENLKIVFDDYLPKWNYRAIPATS